MDHKMIMSQKFYTFAKKMLKYTGMNQQECRLQLTGSDSSTQALPGVLCPGLDITLYEKWGEIEENLEESKKS